jgi:hypothetical protein
LHKTSHSKSWKQFIFLGSGYIWERDIIVYLSFIQHKNLTAYRLWPISFKLSRVQYFQGLCNWFRCWMNLRSNLWITYYFKDFKLNEREYAHIRSSPLSPYLIWWSIGTPICATRLPSRTGCLFTRANYLGSKLDYKNL